MASAAATAVDIDEFINGALVTWLESCLPRPELLTGYAALLDASIIHSVYLQIDPEPQNCPHEIERNASGVQMCISRTKNFECVVKNLKTLYEEEFGQTILVLPDSYMLGYHPESRQGLEQMKLLLTLLLGAAVQCPNKELFIGRIKQLDVETQHAIVELIKQVTDNYSLVLTEESMELLTPHVMYNHILRLTKERDSLYAKWMTTVCTEPESTHTGSNTSENAANINTTAAATTTANTDNNHMAVELADLKSKIRKLRQEVEEKVEGQLELREELEDKIAQYEKLRTESQEWYTEAKRAAAYRDEVDVLRERAERADRLEIEVQKFREKLADAEFYKTRVEELREDNRMLMETKDMLEDQIQRARQRSEHVMQLEAEIIKYKQKLNDMALERDVERSKLEELLDENTQLQLVAKNLNSTHDFKGKSLSDNEEDCNSGDNSLSEQLTNNAQTRALKLELENRRLTAALDQLRESNFHEHTNKMLELEKDKKKLSLQVEQMQENIKRLTQQNNELENVFKNALEENRKLQDTLDCQQQLYAKQMQERELERDKIENLQLRIDTLHKEKGRIQTLNESIQRRADDLERLLDTRTKETQQLTEKVNALQEVKNELTDLQTKISDVETERNMLTKEVQKLQEQVEQKSLELRIGATLLEAQTEEMADLKQRLTSYEEKQNADEIMSENLQKLGLSETPLNVTTVVEKLVRNPDTFKTVREIMLNELENTKSDICVLCHRKDIYTVEKNIDLAADATVLSINVPTQTESVIVQKKSQPQELLFEHKQQRAGSGNNVTTITTLLTGAEEVAEAEEQVLLAENEQLRGHLRTLNTQIATLKTQFATFQQANTQLSADKDVLLKQLETLQQEYKNAMHDQITLQCLHDQLSAEYEALNKDKEQLKVMVRDLRNEARDLREHIVNLEKQLAELQQQNASMRTSADNLALLRSEHSKLTDDFRNLYTTSDRLRTEYKNLQEQYKSIRMENSKLKLQNTELSGDLNARGDQVKLLEMEYIKVAQRCEMLVQMNADLDIDRKTLMENVSQLLSQYHELLAHSLEDKQHFHEEEKSYTERVHNLSRQKEKLEEKIMEHYKKSESAVPKKKPFASSLVRRVKKASSDLMNKVPSRNRRSWVEDARLTQSQFIVGSESGGNDSDNSTEDPLSAASDTRLLQRNMPLRQSLQRNDVLDNCIARGGVTRSSLQAQKRTDLSNLRRNSVHGSLESPDVTGSSLTLGTAGSRRTVYLIDEAQKIPETTTTTNAVGVTTYTTINNNNNNNNNCNRSTPTPPLPVTTIITATTTTTATIPTVTTTTATTISSEPTNNSAASAQNNTIPPTFIMYNRINTVIGGNGSTLDNSDANTTISATGSTTATATAAAAAVHLPDDKLRKRTEDKSNSIWYEYGCV